jgi:hypothetical protein
MSTAPNREFLARLPCEVDNGDDVGDVDGSSDQRRVLVDRSVVRRARMVVALIAWSDELAAKLCFECRRVEFNSCARDMRLLVCGPNLVRRAISHNQHRAQRGYCREPSRRRPAPKLCHGRRSAGMDALRQVLRR